MDLMIRAWRTDEINEDIGFYEVCVFILWKNDVSGHYKNYNVNKI